MRNAATAIAALLLMSAASALPGCGPLSPAAREERLARAALLATIPAAREVKLENVYWRRGCLIGRAAFPGLAGVSPGWHVFAVERLSPSRAIIPTADPEALHGPLAAIRQGQLQATLDHCLTVPLA